MYNWMNT